MSEKSKGWEEWRKKKKAEKQSENEAMEKAIKLQTGDHLKEKAYYWVKLSYCDPKPIRFEKMDDGRAIFYFQAKPVPMSRIGPEAVMPDHDWAENDDVRNPR